ncbi:hypothetical protein U1763_19730 [Sphingomonas sp. LB2R24]|uniref:hypothetical protein n=1 Tax=Sphingomonas sorbitolis TaxID=3096165 RepID=UPI002FC80282
MTSVIVWQERQFDKTAFEEPYVWTRDIWIAADSRISARSEQYSSGHRILTDVAPKILPIRFELFERPEHDPGVRPGYHGELGYAYAGNTLPATMTYSVAVSALARMTADFDAELPTIKDFVTFIAGIGHHYARETGGPFELFVTGVCPQDEYSGPQVWHVVLWSDGRPPNAHQVTFDANRRMYLLGNRKDELRAKCRAGFAADIGYNPTIALNELIEASGVGEIGGLLTLARVDRTGGLTLFPGYGAAAVDGRLPNTFDNDLFGTVGAFEVGLHRS